METLKKVALNTEQLAHELIKDDLINCQFIYGLQQFNINAEQYLLHLSETVFLVLGYEREAIPEPLYNVYYDFTSKHASISPLKQEKTLDELSAEILQKLNHMIANPHEYEEASSNH
jgi:hypothetical protein